MERRKPSKMLAIGVSVYYKSSRGDDLYPLTTMLMGVGRHACKYSLCVNPNCVLGIGRYY